VLITFISIKKGDPIMEIMAKIKGWASTLADTGVSLIALGIVLEVLFNGQGIPFWPNISVIANVQGILGGFSDQGLLGLVAVWILYHIYKSK
tara:strand:- start:188 stop:463 length:276 start_codon:yes stop_codon:yes gene_type:complete